MKTLHTNPDPVFLEKSIQGMIDSPLTRDALNYILEMGKKELLTSNSLVEGGFVFEGAELVDEDGNSYPKVAFQILSVYEVNGERWASGSEFRINLSEFFGYADELAAQAMEKKVDRPTDYSLEQILASI